MKKTGIEIDVKRLGKDLLALGEFGKNTENHGVTRQAFTNEDTAAKHWLIEQFKKIDVHARIDEAGNVIARYGPKDGPCVATGSHIDSVPSGGMFDGTLGVLTGLECLRVIKEKKIELKRPIEVIAFADEEGRFGGMFGVEAICGQLNPEFIESAADIRGNTLVDAMKSQGLEPLNALAARRDPDSFHSFVEVHIEQGPVLEASKNTIGVVNGISGVFKWMVKLIGKAGHAGTSPMNMRSDAFQGVADFAHEKYRIIEEDGSESSRLTIGRVELKPGFPHTIPGEVEFSLVGRDINNETMEQLAMSCRKVLSTIARKHKLMFEYRQLSWLKPQPCHEDIVNKFKKHAENLDLKYQVMPSGAGHDTQFMCQVTRGGMIFVPSVDGISHAPDEHTHWDDIEKGGDLLLHTIIDLCNE